MKPAPIVLKLPSSWSAGGPAPSLPHPTRHSSQYPERDELIKERIITARSSTAPSSVRLLGAQFRDAEQEVRRTLPSKISDGITITDVYSEGNRFVYVYDVDRELHTLFRQPEVLKAQKGSVQEAVCANASMAKDMSKGIIYGYFYRDKVTKEKSGYFEFSSCWSLDRKLFWVRMIFIRIYFCIVRVEGSILNLRTYYP